MGDNKKIYTANRFSSSPKIYSNSFNELKKSNTGTSSNLNNSSSKRDSIYRSFSRQVPGQSRWLTRELAALDFLLNIPLQQEREIVRAGLEGRTYHRNNKSQHQKNKSTSVNFESETVFAPNESIVSNAPTPFSSNVDLSSMVPKTADIDDVPEGSTQVEDNGNNKGGKEGGRWWEKLMLKEKSFFMEENQKRETLKAQLELEEKELELPGSMPKLPKSMEGENSLQPQQVDSTQLQKHQRSQEFTTPIIIAPGRRLEGLDASVIKLPLPPPSTSRATRQKAVARSAMIREWEVRVAHGINRKTPQTNKLKIHDNTSIDFEKGKPETKQPQGALLDGRIFFSAQKGYPLGVFSVVKYEPKKEEAARRRKKIEAMGGGGTKFAIPPRDWSKYI